MNRTKEVGKTSFLKRLLFSRVLEDKNQAHKIAYIAVTTALCIIVNTLEIKLTVAQFSFTIFFSAFAGVVLGGGAGFCACFLGDMLGFFIHPMGEYSPWIGISTGLMAFFAAAVLYCSKQPRKNIYLKLTLACVLIFVVCTSGITALYLNKVWYSSMGFFEYLSMRLFVQGQIWNSVFNSVLIVLGIPALVKIKAFKINL